MHENNFVEASGLKEARRCCLGLEEGVTAVEARRLGNDVDIVDEIDVADREGTMGTP